MAPLERLRAPLIAACALVARSHPDEKLAIRLTLVVDEPDEVPRTAMLAESLAREFGLAATLEMADGVVRVRLSRSSIPGREVGVRERGEPAAPPLAASEFRRDLEELDVVGVRRR
jgi:hypothetical protein